MSMSKTMEFGKMVRRPHPRLLVGLTLLIFFVAGCALTPSRTPRASTRWSNGTLLGIAALNNPVALQVDQSGASFMIWVGLDHDLHFARLDQRAGVVAQHPLVLETHSPLRHQLQRDSTGQLHLAWLDRWGQGEQLFYARLSADGNVLQGSTAISPPEQRTAHCSMVLDPTRRTVELFWSDNTPVKAGCYHAALDWSGAVIAPPELLIPQGILPEAQVDREGYVHLAWRVDPDPGDLQFRYAIYDPRHDTLGSDIMVAEPVAQASLIGRPTAGISFDGPWLGLDEHSAYVAWVLEVREMGDVMDFTSYQAFPLPLLDQRADDAALSYTSPMLVNDVVLLEGFEPSLTGHPRFLPGQPTRQALACYTQIAGAGDVETLQIAVMEVQPGHVEAQEIVNASRAASVRPSVAIDSQGDLHAVWIDTAGFRRYQVVYASTSHDVRRTLNRITSYEVVDAIMSRAMRAISTLFFVPLALTWMFAPIGWLVVFTLATHVSEVGQRRGNMSVVLSMLLHLLGKLIFLPGSLVRSPFSALASPLLSLVLGRWLLPLVLAGVSAVLLRLYLKRGHSQSIFAAYFIFAVVDSILTLLIYILPLMGAI
jgi:hypothetical protein